MHKSDMIKRIFFKDVFRATLLSVSIKLLSKKSKQLKDKLTPALFVFATVVLVFLILLVAQSLIDE